MGAAVAFANRPEKGLRPLRPSESRSIAAAPAATARPANACARNFTCTSPLAGHLGATASSQEDTDLEALKLRDCRKHMQLPQLGETLHARPNLGGQQGLSRSVFICEVCSVTSLCMHFTCEVLRLSFDLICIPSEFGCATLLLCAGACKPNACCHCHTQQRCPKRCIRSSQPAMKFAAAPRS